jgi:hypothetical protein
MIKNNFSGYIAITSALIISAVALSIVTSGALIAISGMQISFNDKKQSQGLNLIESCAEDVLLYLNNSNSLPANVAIPEGVCTITLNSQINQDWDFDVLGNFNNQNYILRINATRSYRVIVNSWQQVTS